MKTALSFAFAACALAGCASLDQLTGSSKPAPARDAWVMTGAACSTSHPFAKDESDADRAQELICNRWSGFGQSIDLFFDLSKRHARLDDRRPDPLTTSAIVLTCARLCNPSYDVMSVGMSAVLAETIDEGALKERVATLGWPAAQQEFFLARIRDGIAKLRDQANAMDPRVRAVAIDLPKKIRADRARYYQAHAREYAALDAIQANRLADLERVRAAYFATCTAPECRFDPLPVEVTKRIVQGALANHDDLRAAAEGALFTEHGSLRNTYAPMVYRGEYLAARALEQLADDYDHAKQGGADEATLDAKFGAGRVPRIHAGWVWTANDEAPDLLRGIAGDGVTGVGGVVAAVRTKGAVAEIAFEDQVLTFNDEDCVETDKIDRIRPDGTIEYRHNCRVVGTSTERRVTPPVRVPLADARGLRPKELVSVVVGADRVGLVVSARDQHNELVQLRGLRLEPKAVYHAISSDAEIDRGKKPRGGRPVAAR